MTTNKSIDGLSTRAAKAKTAVKRPAVKKPKKPTPEEISEEFINTPTSNIWDSIKPDEEPDNESDTNSDKEVTKEKPKTSKTDFLDPVEPSHLIEPDDPTSPARPKPPVKKPKPKKVKKVDSFTTTDFLKPVQAFDFSEEEGLKESEDTVEDLRKTLDEDPNEPEDLTEEDDTNKDKENQKKSKREKRLERKLEKKLDKKSKKKPSKKRRIISIIALIIVLLLIGVTVWAILWGNDIIAKLTGGRGNLLDLFSETYEPLKTDANGRTNILAFGTGGYDMYGETGGGVHDGADLTDSIMLISFDQNTGDVAMLSLPRDLKGPATCTSTGKINEVYWCNGGNGDATVEEEEIAATALMEAVGSILGVDIQYFAHLNWGSIVSIVDTLGGITVTLDEDILDYEFTEAVFKAGVPYTINGAEAVGLARARHGTQGGDFSRGASQQKIIIGIKNRIFEKELSITDLLGLVTTLGDNLRTNFSVSEMKSLAHDTQILDFDIMRQLSLYPDYMTAGMINGISYVYPSAGVGNYSAIQAYVSKQLSSDPRVYEDSTIAIYNASDTDGLAASERAKLEEAGYTINLIDNAPAGEYPAGTTVYAVNPEKAGTKRLLEEYYNIYTTSAEELPATIAPNYDFIIILNN